MTTIKDIARLAGVSIATVSRVLNGQSGVSENKRQKVLQVAEETHYSLSRFSSTVKEKTPHILVLFVAEPQTPEVRKILIDACETARSLFQNDMLKVEYYTASELPQAISLLQRMQQQQEDLEGLMIVGTPPESLHRSLVYLRGRGCPVVLTGAYDDDLSPLSLIRYDIQMFYALVTETLLLVDRERIGLFIHAAKHNLNGEGCFSQPAFQYYLDRISAHYPEKSVRVHNKGKFTPELVPACSAVLLDSTAASEAVIEHYQNESVVPHIIAYGTSPVLQQALQTGKIAALIDLSLYDLAFRSMFSMLQRLILKQAIPDRQWVYPDFYLPSMLPVLKYKQKYPVLL